MTTFSFSSWQLIFHPSLFTLHFSLFTLDADSFNHNHPVVLCVLFRNGDSLCVQQPNAGRDGYNECWVGCKTVKRILQASEQVRLNNACG